MRLARWIFIIAGIYGLLLIAPMYLFESRIAPHLGKQPEFYYGFLGVVLAWQICFLIIGREPRRHRPIMVAAIIEKFSYAAAVGVLFWQQRVTGITLAGGIIDLILGSLFIVAFLETSRAERHDELASGGTSRDPTEAGGPLI